MLVQEFESFVEQINDSTREIGRLREDKARTERYIAEIIDSASSSNRSYHHNDGGSTP